MTNKETKYFFDGYYRAYGEIMSAIIRMEGDFGERLVEELMGLRNVKLRDIASSGVDEVDLYTIKNGHKAYYKKYGIEEVSE